MGNMPAEVIQLLCKECCLNGE
ncbi:hypothetical protein CCACVL1_07556 [Corchorus capsularis]|uniref:Uncharacterized protein n=1 Tax=Corchorus capsularis TaxID=210143 RepID=A0A1R3J567_COCAP|nr:hypothetical protein CCACVL1_07556 [Corchorus capsularis]